MMPPAIISREPIPLHEVAASPAPVARKEHGTLFKADMVRALQRDVDPKSQTRRLFTRHNSLVDGRRATPALWADLDFDAAWVDAGPSPAGNAGPYLKVPRRSDESVHRVYATIAAGDRLWVRETHAPQADCWGSWERWLRGAGGEKPIIHYAADFQPYQNDRGLMVYKPFIEKWRSSIHMPRWASRVLLEITAVRIQRLQEIDERDAIAEGIDKAHVDGLGRQRWRFYQHDDGVPGEEIVRYCGPLHTLRPVESYRSLWLSINGPGSWAANPWVRVFEVRRLTP